VNGAWESQESDRPFVRTQAHRRITHMVHIAHALGKAAAGDTEICELWRRGLLKAAASSRPDPCKIAV
jgi:hypothetical protein